VTTYITYVLSYANRKLRNDIDIDKTKQTSWLLSASELYWPSDRRLSAVSTHFSGEKVSRGQHSESPRPLISVFYTGDIDIGTYCTNIMLDIVTAVIW
jgi:hypothetical protein